MILVVFILPLAAMIWFLLTQRFTYGSGTSIWGRLAVKAMIGVVLGGVGVTFLLPLFTITWDFNTDIIYRRSLFGFLLFRKTIPISKVHSVNVVALYHKSFGTKGGVVYAVQLEMSTGRKYLICQASTKEQATEDMGQIQSALGKVKNPLL
jgi:hypothetical protein